mgnify:CR=1 FL=1
MRYLVPAVVALILLLTITIPQPASSQGELPVFLKNPALSPDGTLVAFDYEGDIWTVPVEGGQAKRLTLHLGFERRPYFSPDGQWLVYCAAYYGNYDLFIIPVTGGEPRRLTYAPSSEIPSAWSADGKHIYFYSFRDNLYDIFRIPAEGGTAVRLAEARRDGFAGPVPSPDGTKLVFNYRSGYNAWNRQGFVSPNSSEIFLADNTAPATNFKRLTTNWNQDFLPTWSPDGMSLYYASDKDGVYNLYQMTLDGDSTASQITKFTDRGVRWFTVAAKAGNIVIERDHRLYKVDPNSGEATLIEITMYNPPRVTEPEVLNKKVEVDSFVVSPDSKKIALIVGHDIYVMATTGGYMKPVTRTPERELHMTWGPDSNHVIFNRIVDGTMQILRADIRTGEVKQLTSGKGNKFTPIYHPDGKRIAYQYEYEELRLFEPEMPEAAHETMVKGVFARRLLTDGRWFDFTADGKWLAYNDNNSVMGMSAKVKKLGDDSQPVDLSVLGSNCYPAGFSPDYTKFLMSHYTTRQVVYVFDFVKEIKPRESPVQKLEDLLSPPEEPKKEEVEKVEGDQAKKPDEESPKAEPEAEPVAPAPAPGDVIDFSDLMDKVRPLAPGLAMNQYTAHIMKNGKSVILVGYGTPSGYNLYVVPLDGGPHQQLTNTPGNKSGFEIDSQEKFFYYISDGALFGGSLASRNAAKLTPNTVTVPVNTRDTRKAVFSEILWILDAGFYDPQHHGQNVEHLRATYGPLVERCTDDSSFRTLMSQLTADFNASHMGVESAPGDTQLGIAADSTPVLGFWFDDALAEKGQLKVKRLLRGTPAAADGSGIKEGDFVISINGVKFGPSVDVYKVLRNKLGEELKLELADSPDGETRVVYLPTVSLDAYYQANMLDWEDANRRYVEKQSGGKLGYIHLRSMMDNDYTKFMNEMPRYLDRCEGVILDFRYNSGGRISKNRKSTILNSSHVSQTRMPSFA